MEINNIIKIAEGAGKIILSYYKKEYEIIKKEDKSPVTTADYESQKYILKKLKAYNYPIIAEESKNNTEKKSEYYWLVDPLDGTQHFIDKTGEFSVLIALMRHNKPFIGVIHIPTKNETYYAIKGKGAYKVKNNKKIKIHTSKNGINDIRFITSKKCEKTPNEILKLLKPKKKKFVGGTGIKIIKIAEGKFDLNIRENKYIKEWDTAAGEIIVKEAGGKITDFYGKELEYNYGKCTRNKRLIISNGIIHDKIVNMIKNFNSL